MELSVQKQQLIDEILRMKDARLIEAILGIITKSQKVERGPMSIEAFYAKIEASENAFEHGQVTTHQDLIAEIQNWKEK